MKTWPGARKRHRRGSEPAASPGLPILELTRADLETTNPHGSDVAPPAAGDEPRTGTAPAGQPGTDLASLHREIESVARYVERLRREISLLRLNEVATELLPAIREDLSGVTTTSRSAAERIIAEAEAMLRSPAPDVAAYKADAERHVIAILEACSFQDITGQRLARAELLLNRLHRRLQRFSTNVAIDDARDAFDREAILHQARREVLMVDGPQARTAAMSQDAVDQLFG